MEISKDKQPKEQTQVQASNTISSDELKRLTDFFSILMQIDKRIAKTSNYGKQDK